MATLSAIGRLFKSASPRKSKNQEEPMAKVTLTIEDIEANDILKTKRINVRIESDPPFPGPPTREMLAGREERRDTMAQRAGELCLRALQGNSAEKNMGRNALCKCGSGKKFKRCCGK